jgi:hypothetical protein
MNKKELEAFAREAAKSIKTEKTSVILLKCWLK